jgi:hypothetical protein
MPIVKLLIVLMTRPTVAKMQRNADAVPIANHLVVVIVSANPSNPNH